MAVNFYTFCLGCCLLAMSGADLKYLCYGAGVRKNFKSLYIPFIYRYYFVSEMAYTVCFKVKLALLYMVIVCYKFPKRKKVNESRFILPYYSLTIYFLGYGIYEGHNPGHRRWSKRCGDDPKGSCRCRHIRQRGASGLERLNNLEMLDSEHFLQAFVLVTLFAGWSSTHLLDLGGQQCRLLHRTVPVSLPSSLCSWGLELFQDQQGRPDVLCFKEVPVVSVQILIVGFCLILLLWFFIYFFHRK